jgi:hypothetical protein
VVTFGPNVWCPKLSMMVVPDQWPLTARRTMTAHHCQNVSFGLIHLSLFLTQAVSVFWNIYVNFTDLKLKKSYIHHLKFKDEVLVTGGVSWVNYGTKVFFRIRKKSISPSHLWGMEYINPNLWNRLNHPWTFKNGSNYPLKHFWKIITNHRKIIKGKIQLC